MDTATPDAATPVVIEDEAGALAADADLPASRNPVTVYLAGLQSEASRRTMRSSLRTLTRMVIGNGADPEDVPWWRAEYQHAAALRARLAEEYAPATVNKHLSALRGVLREAWRLGLMDAEAYQRVADVSGLKSDRLPQGRRLTLGEIFALKEACEADEGPAGARDKALLAVLARGGLRRSEVVDLRLRDYAPEAGDGEAAELRVRNGKGNKGRVVALANGARQAVDEWIDVRGEEPGALFVPIRKDGTLEYRHMTAQAVYLILRRRADDAGVKHFTPHDLRRTCASDLLEQGNDLSVAQKMLGHASTDTTARYDVRGDAAKRKAATTLPF